MRPLPRLALVIAAVATALAVGPAPAQAAVVGSTSTSDVVLYQHCQQHAVSYAVEIPQGTTFWYLRLALFDPSGANSEGNVVTATTTGAASGTFHVQFCGSEPTGTWTVRATGFTQVLPLVEMPFVLPDTPFEVRPMATRTTLAKQQPGHGRVLVTRVRQQAEHGYVRANGIPVRLEKLVHGRWQRVRGLTLTTVHGRAAATVGAAGTYRAVVREIGNHGASMSKPVRLG